MKEIVVIVDGGGRGSVQAEKYAQSPLVNKLIAIPGNDWILYKTTNKEVEIFPALKTTDVTAITKICGQMKPSLVVVSQDNAIAAGLVDSLAEAEIPVLGPTQQAGKLEWDKAYSRRLLSKLDIPQPKFKVFSSGKNGINYILDNPNQDYFIKASGLCEGKGALPARNKNQAIEAILKMKRFGQAGKTYLVEEWLKNDDGTPGEEFSAFALSDGFNFQILGTAKDHKRANNFDEGENTGGMGCISPHPNLNKETLGKVEEIFDKTFSHLRKLKKPYRGILYLGGMVVGKAGKQTPYVIEFNARWGDPEAQSIIPGIKNDFCKLGMAVLNKDLKNLKIETDNLTRVVIAGVTRGYPGPDLTYTNKEIFGIDQAIELEEIRFYGGGLKIVDGHYFTPKKPSRLFYVVGEGDDIWAARTKAYGALKEVRIPEIGLHYRTDIALTALSKRHPV
ncbi:phosphoribosylamine--glycine ligase [Candidatus Daviesbacteria bacterium]|nr:phosphoribosylamine--glycine ligase [Candidatus Daviesbacteria bacterium]